ncbi:MAG: uridine kinase [Chloroflexota bacterium]|nr:uridine kinase [Chloroflexota bacterium]
MKGDVVIIEKYHREAAAQIVSALLAEIQKKGTRYTLTVAGESGSGKSEMGQAIRDELAKHAIQAVVLGQDDYFVLPPYDNDARRREDPEWLGPHIELKMDCLESNLKEALDGAERITKPLIDYNRNTIEEETLDLTGVKVVIAEGTYTSLLKHIDRRVFIDSSRLDTLAYRKKRNRGKEVGDAFIEQVLSMEHKIIAGHKNLADFVIRRDHQVERVD